MKVQLETIYRDVAASPAVVANIRRRAVKLDRFADEIATCHVTVAASHRVGHKGQVYTVRVQLVARDPQAADGPAPDAERNHADMQLAIHHAFDAVLDQLRRRESARQHGTRAVEGGHEAPEKFNV